MSLLTFTTYHKQVTVVSILDILLFSLSKCYTSSISHLCKHTNASTNTKLSVIDVCSDPQYIVIPVKISSTKMSCHRLNKHFSVTEYNKNQKYARAVFMVYNQVKENASTNTDPLLPVWHDTTTFTFSSFGLIPNVLVKLTFFPFCLLNLN